MDESKELIIRFYATHWETVRELIRCKDCEYRCLPNQTHMPDMYPCKVWGKEVYPHEWCSRAERKEE